MFVPRCKPVKPKESKTRYLYFNKNVDVSTERRSSSVVRVLAYHVKGSGFESRPGHCAAWIWVYYSCGSAASFGWDVKPRSSLCSTPNMDYKDPDITEEENLWLPAHTDYIHIEERVAYAASGHRDPRLEFSRKGAIKNKGKGKGKWKDVMCKRIGKIKIKCTWWYNRLLQEIYQNINSTYLWDNTPDKRTLLRQWQRNCQLMNTW